MSQQQGRDGGGTYTSSSPHSSNGLADSYKGTPDTRLSAFSPDEGSTKSIKVAGSLSLLTRETASCKHMASSATLGGTGSFYRGSLHLNGDPFVSSSESVAKGAQKLSPTASSFFPVTSASAMRASASEPTPSSKGKQESSDQAYSSPSHQRNSERSASLIYLQPRTSTDSGMSRCLVLTGRYSDLSTVDVEEYIMELEERGLPMQGTHQINKFADKIYVRFSNIRTSCVLASQAGLNGRDWSVKYVAPRHFTQVINPTAGNITNYEGQVFLTVFSCTSQPVHNAKQLEDIVKGLLLSEGDLFAFKLHPGPEHSLLSAVAEFCDNEISLRAVERFRDIIHKEEQIQICSALHRPDILPTSGASEGINSPIRYISADSELAAAMQGLAVSRRPSSLPLAGQNNMVHTPARSVSSPSPFGASYGMPVPMVYSGLPMSPPYALDQMQARYQGALLPSSNYSLVGSMVSPTQSYPSTDLMTPRQYQGMGRGDGRRQNAPRAPRPTNHFYNSQNHHNQVDIDRIRKGTDVRTTIMLRNIPNKVDQAMLKNIVDESSWGKYDFMYLRIDFQNECNVGYAFINFVDPLDIIDFVNARGNQRWNCFRSDKVAEISYATIQGKDCLVQKFRNSSVMLEHQHYRPKLFYTSNGPCPDMAGLEETFPQPDNQSKMKRSVENAEHVGLFTPNSGQHYRDEQRRRRSQYDRGTRLAALQEHNFEVNDHYSHYSPQ